MEVELKDIEIKTQISTVIAGQKFGIMVKTDLSMSLEEQLSLFKGALLSLQIKLHEEIGTPLPETDASIEEFRLHAA